MPGARSRIGDLRLRLSSAAVLLSGLVLPAVLTTKGIAGETSSDVPASSPYAAASRDLASVAQKLRPVTAEERVKLEKWKIEAQALEAADDWLHAETIWRRCLALEEIIYGRDHSSVAETLGLIGGTLRQLGRYAEAEPLYQRALAIREKSLGPNHLDTAASIDDLANVRYDQHQYAEAELLYSRALTIREILLGPNHLKTADSLDSLAWTRSAQGRHAEADSLFARALAIRETALGPDHPDTAASVQRLAYIRNVQIRYAEAEPLYVRHLAIDEKNFGPTSIKIIGDLNDLADIREKQGNYANSEALYRRALNIREKKFGYDHPQTADSLHFLTQHYVYLGNYTEAEPLIIRTIAIYEKVFGPEHPGTLNGLNTLAGVYYLQGRYAEAEKIMLRVLAGDEKNNDSNNYYNSASFGKLADIYKAQGRYADAEPLYKRSIAGYEKLLWAEHPTTVDRLTSLADNHAAQGRYAEAELLYERALAIYEKVLGPDHPSTATSLGRLAINHTAQGHYAEALPLARRAVAIWAGRIARNGEAGGEQRAGTDSFLILARLLSEPGRFPDLSEPNRLAEAFHALQYVSSADVARAVSSTLARAAAGSDDLARLVRTRQDLTLKARALSADLDRVVAKPAEQRDAANDATLRAQITRTEADLDAATVRLTREFPRFAELANPRPASLADVQAALRPDEGLVSWTVTPSATYLFVVRRGGAHLQRIAIKADALRARVAALRDGLDPKGRLPIDMPPFDLAAAHALYRDLLGPAEDLIGDARHLILVPDGPLQSLPPAVLVTAPPLETGDEAERYRQAAWLVRRQAVSLAPAVSSFVALRRFPKDEIAGSTQVADLGGAFAGYGDPDFQGSGPDRERTPAPAALNKAEAPVALASLFRGGSASPDGLHALPRLTDSADELRAIAHALDAPDASVHLGREASVSAITGADLSKVKVLAFATHGLIAGELPKLAEPALAFTPPAEPSAADDGLLRASQVAQLKLGAQFVVLSACNTAAPDGTPGASGLSGLAKAFFYAGARSLLVSHWPVDSGAATRLTTATFATLRAEPGIGRAEALRRASLALIDGGRPGNLDAHPMIWAPFTLVGEDGAEPAGLTTSHADTIQPTQK